MQNLILTLLRFYQRWISAMFPPRCRFVPTCSSYTMEAVETFGAGRGLWLGLTRLLRCHPWGKSGYDPVPSACCGRSAPTETHYSSSGEACDSQSHARAQIRGYD